MLKYLKLRSLFSTVNIKLNPQKKAVEIVLANSKKRNPLSIETMNEIYQKLIEVEKYAATEQAKIMILKSEGPVFSAGHDLKQLQASKNPAQIFDLCARLMLKLRSIPIPTICAVNGIATAAGFQLTMACDLVLATRNSSFGCLGIKLGLFCSTPGVELVRSINSQKKANQILFFGQPISAEEAYRYGILNKVLQNEEALNRQVENYIDKANQLSSDVIKLGKETLIKQRTQSIEQAYETAGKTMVINVTQKPDCRQGLAAFSEKRKPSYKH